MFKCFDIFFVGFNGQAFGGYVDYDLTNILRQLHGDLKAQKILLVGHSQGTFYTNAAYDYLVKNGVDKKSIAVYNIGTPADKVAGNGEYLTSSNLPPIPLYIIIAAPNTGAMALYPGTVPSH